MSENPILRFFDYGHLPPHLQAVSKPIGDLAYQMADQLPPGPELSAGLRKLLEAKDAFVRAALPAPGGGGHVRPGQSAFGDRLADPQSEALRRRQDQEPR